MVLLGVDIVRQKLLHVVEFFIPYSTKNRCNGKTVILDFCEPKILKNNLGFSLEGQPINSRYNVRIVVTAPIFKEDFSKYFMTFVTHFKMLFKLN